MPAPKRTRAGPRLQSLQKNSPHIHVELALIQNRTARLCANSEGIFRVLITTNNAMRNVGTIMITPSVCESIHQQVSFTNQKMMCRFSTRRSFSEIITANVEKEKPGHTPGFSFDMILDQYDFFFLPLLLLRSLSPPPDLPP